MALLRESGRSSQRPLAISCMAVLSRPSAILEGKGAPDRSGDHARLPRRSRVPAGCKRCRSSTILFTSSRSRWRRGTLRAWSVTERIAADGGSVVAPLDGDRCGARGAGGMRGEQVEARCRLLPALVRQSEAHELRIREILRRGAARRVHHSVMRAASCRFANTRAHQHHGHQRVCRVRQWRATFANLAAALNPMRLDGAAAESHAVDRRDSR